MPNLLLCMTPGVGISDWKNAGILSREIKPYLEYIKRGWNVKILTSKKSSINKIASKIEIVSTSSSRLLPIVPWIYRYLGKWANVIKTNQSIHSYFYTEAAKRWRKPILLRCGYVHGEYLEMTQNRGIKTRLYQALEGKAFRDATSCIVPTPELSNWLQDKYQIAQDQINIVPNFVDLELFKPVEQMKKISKSIIAVGRLHPVKRFDMLVRACAQIPECQLTVVGEGPERSKLELLAKRLNVRLNLPGKIIHEKLSHIINKHKIFAMTSAREGHPKALIEALSCEIPCIVTKAVGVDNILTHGSNGWVVNGSVSAIRDGLKMLLSDEVLCNTISRNGRKLISEKYNFSYIMDKEFAIVEKLLK